MTKEIKPLHTEESPLLSQGGAKHSNGDVENAKVNITSANGDADGDVKSNHDHDEHATLWHDILDTFHLSLPIFVSRVSFVGMTTTDTALLGHVSGQSLSAAALSDLWRSCTAVLIRGRVLGIVVGQAIGAKNEGLAFIYLKISCLILGALSIIVIFSWTFTEQIWVYLGQSPTIAKDAQYYSSVFIASIPASLWFGQLAQFLSAQRIMRPEVITSLLALGCNLILGITLVLGIPSLGFEGYGFAACPWVTVVVVWCQAIFLTSIWLQKHYHTLPNQKQQQSTTNPSKILSAWTRGITLERIRTFSALYYPAALATSSDFWRMGVIGEIAATIGEREVGVFNASYRIMWITIIFVGSLAGAAGIKIGMRLGRGDADGARRAAAVGIGLAISFLFVLSAMVYCNMRALGMLFTNDPSYLELFVECRWPFTCVLFFMNLSVGIETIPMSMGQTGKVFYAGFVASWFGQVPGVILLTRYWRKDLYGLYTGVAVGYCVLVFIYGWLAYSSDYRKYSEIARKRAEVA